MKILDVVLFFRQLAVFINFHAPASVPLVLKEMFSRYKAALAKENLVSIDEAAFLPQETVLGTQTADIFQEMKAWAKQQYGI